MTFASLGLHPDLLGPVAEYAAPTPVQAACVPAILAGRDVWTTAPTGSGKTAAYALPILHALAIERRGQPRSVAALVLVPTRELAAQVGGVFVRLGRDLAAPVRTGVLFGGVSVNPQMMALRGGAEIIVATPGRLLDLVARNALTLASVRTLVLDEADRMLSMGFADELERTLSRLPEKRQTLLFSATFPPGVRSLAAAQLRDPARFVVESHETSEIAALQHRAIEVDADARTRLLLHLLESHGWDQVLVFVASRHAADHVSAKLRKAGVQAAALHGDLAQGTRTRALADLATKRARVLVATDVAARGLDIVELPAVVSYDLPRSASDYVHRSGRTARAGAAGVCVSFVTPDARAHFGLIEKRNRIAVVIERLEGFIPTERAPETPAPQTAGAANRAVLAGGVKGARKSKKDKLREAAAAAALSGGRSTRP